MSLNREPGGKTSPEEPLNLKKELLIFGLAILVLAAFIYVTGNARRTTAVRAEGRDLVRLHVVANSDDPVDQAVKLKVRDRVLKDIGSELASSTDAKQALAIAETELGWIEAVARDELSQNNLTYGAKAIVGTFSFPDRTYGNLVLPAGRYNALRVVLGEGKGQNWWCVLFPPLCLVDVAVDSGKKTQVHSTPNPPAGMKNIRTTLESAGYSVGWKPLTRTITVANGGSSATISPGEYGLFGNSAYMSEADLQNVIDKLKTSAGNAGSVGGRGVTLVAPDETAEVQIQVKWKVFDWLRKTTLGQIMAQVTRPGHGRTSDARP